MSQEKLFYLQDSRSNVGTNVSFWRKGGAGYGCGLGELETYTLEEAQRQHDCRETDIPLLKELVDKLSISAVDCQVLPESEPIDNNGEYVIQIKGHWNGNDILFVGGYQRTYNYESAKIFTIEEVNRHYSDANIYHFFSKTAIDEISRRTFQEENIDKYRMIRKPGIKLKKPKRARYTTGKSRGNCPVCGRITWDYNPYENAYCTDHDSEFKRM